jgi:amino acid transporter
VGARYAFLLVGWDSAAESKTAVMIFAVLIILVMTAICVIGTELSARLQNVLIIAQVGALLLFAAWALARVIGGDAPDGSVDPSLSWLNPLEVESGSALTAGLLLGVFIYWGWESAVNLTEEVEDSSSAPGRAAVLSTVLLLATYVLVAVAVVAFAGPELLTEFDDDESVLGTLAEDALPGGLDKLVVLAIVTSAIASTQTTILPASRTSLSMSRRSAMPEPLGRVHTRFLTPHVSTWTVGFLAIAWYVPANAISENFLFDSLSALSLMIAFYYALTGIACAIYFRHALLASARNFLLIGVAPLIGAGLLLWLLVESVIDLSDPANSYTGDAILGVGPPLAIGLFFMALGVVLMVIWRIRGHERYWKRPTETAPDALVTELKGRQR